MTSRSARVIDLDIPMNCAISCNAESCNKQGEGSHCDAVAEHAASAAEGRNVFSESRMFATFTTCSNTQRSEASQMGVSETSTLNSGILIIRTPK